MSPPPSPLAVSEAALFRFRVVSEVLAEMLRGQRRGAALKQVAARVHAQLDGSERHVGLRTLQRWMRLYEHGGLQALEPSPRQGTDSSVTLSEPLLSFVREQKQLDPPCSVPELIARARQLGIIAEAERIDRTTLWRAVVRMGLPTRMRATKHEGDMRRFAYLHRMQMVLSDGKHFRAGVKRLRRVALFFLDDCSRYGLGVVVGTSESAQLFLRGLWLLIERHGLMDAMYLDRGPGFVADDTSAVMGRLERALLLGTAAYPEGHGKIERFNRSAIARVLRSLDGNPEVDPSLEALELRLSHFLEHYNDLPHESLGGLSPRQKWQADARELSFPKDRDWLQSRFTVSEDRTVSKDHVIQFDGTDYEAPHGLGRQKVQVQRNVLSGELSVLHEGSMQRLHPVDLARNARDRRGRRRSPPPIEREPVKTAATLAYERDHAPLVNADGGFSDED